MRGMIKTQSNNNHMSEESWFSLPWSVFNCYVRHPHSVVSTPTWCIKAVHTVRTITRRLVSGPTHKRQLATFHGFCCFIESSEKTCSTSGDTKVTMWGMRKLQHWLLRLQKLLAHLFCIWLWWYIVNNILCPFSQSVPGKQSQSVNSVGLHMTPWDKKKKGFNSTRSLYRHLNRLYDNILFHQVFVYMIIAGRFWNESSVRDELHPEWYFSCITIADISIVSLKKEAGATLDLIHLIMERTSLFEHLSAIVLVLWPNT